VRADARRAAGAVLTGLALLLATEAAGAQGTFRSGAHAGRAYHLYVPAALVAEPTDPPPLAVALHGCGQTPEDFAAGTRLNTVAERRRLLVLYPTQGMRSNPTRCWNWFEPASRERGEVAEILGLVQHVGGRHRFDRDRVVVVGFSAGGFMDPQ